jgi:hypothetical protein
MKKLAKFTAQIDEETLSELKARAKKMGRSISSVLNEAVNDYLQRSNVRPEFRNAVDEVAQEHNELLRKLAK